MTSNHTILVKSALEFLAINKFFTWENNTGALKTEDRFVRFGQPGSADILGCLPDGRMLGAEAKTGSGKQRKNQKIFQSQLEKNNGLYVLFYSVAELQQKLIEAGYSCQIPTNHTHPE